MWVLILSLSICRIFAWRYTGRSSHNTLYEMQSMSFQLSIGQGLGGIITLQYCNILRLNLVAILTEIN